MQLAFSLILILSLASPIHATAQVEVSAQINSQGLNNSLVFSGTDQWVYRISRTKIDGKAAFELDAPKIKDADLQKVLSWKSPLIQKVELSSSSPSNRSVLRFFPTGNEVELFDYQTDQPSRLIVDIFKENEQKEQPTAQTPSKATVAQAKPVKKVDSVRKPASDILKVADAGPIEFTAPVSSAPVSPTPTGEASTPEVKAGVYDGADPNFSRFTIQDYEIKEEAIISSKQNYYMEFPQLRLDLHSLNTMMGKRPIFEIASKDTEENKQARLIQTLHENKRHHVLLKTVEWFKKKFPESEYSEIVDAITAEAQFSIWIETLKPTVFDQAMLSIRQFTEKYPGSVLVPQYQLLIGFANLKRGDHLNAVRAFKSFIRDQPNSPHVDLARLAIAESHLKINQLDEAISIYKSVMNEGKNLADRHRAAFYVGDAELKKKDYKAAIASYQNAISKFPEAVPNFPNAIYNQASANFHLGEYKESLEQYRKFLTRFPDDSYAGYAMTRVGELLEILGAPHERVVGAFLETTFRYGNSPSAIVANLRLKSSRFPGMKPKEVEKTSSEILALAKESALPNIEQFANLMVAEGFTRREEYDKAVEILVKFYQQNPTTADTALLSSRIAKNINDKIRSSVNKGDFWETLRTYDQYSQSWLKGSSRIDTKYFIGRAYELGGAYQEAEKLYRKVINEMYSLGGTQAGRERNIFEKLPPTDEVNLRLASVAYQRGRFNEANQYLVAMKQPEILSDNQQIERIELAANLLQQRGDVTSAVRYLTEVLRVYKGKPALTAQSYFDLAMMELKLGKTQDALKSLTRINDLQKDSGEVSPVVHAKALQKLADLYLDAKQNTEAIATFNQMLEAYEKSMPLVSTRYRLGKIYFQQGDLKQANEVWSKLPQEGAGAFWSKLAKESLKNSSWRDEYQQYTGRIPAMATDQPAPEAERRNE